MLHRQLFLWNISPLNLFKPKLHVIHLLILIFGLHNKSGWSRVKLRIVGCETVSLSIIVLLEAPNQATLGANTLGQLKVVVNEITLLLGYFLLHTIVKIGWSPNKLALLYNLLIN